jgi:hypothetical protein
MSGIANNTMVTVVPLSHRVTPSLFVKNTFIDFPQEAAKGEKRSSSLPPRCVSDDALRDQQEMLGASKPNKDVEDGVSTMDSLQDAGYHSCTDSTDAEDSKDEDVASSSGCESSGDDQAASRKAASEVREISPTTRKKMSWFEESEIGEVLPDDLVSAQLIFPKPLKSEGKPASAKVVQPTKPSSPTRTPLRTCLSSNATPWQPTETMPAGDAMVVQNFDHSVAMIVGMVKAVLVACGIVSGVDAISSGIHEGAQRQGWIIIVRVRPQDAHLVENIVTLAKEQFVSAAQRSPSADILGCGAQAFEVRPQGFVLKLGAMGHCQQSSSCQWQQPVAVSSIGLKVDVFM